MEGFSILELLVVLCITFIVSGICYMSLRRSDVQGLTSCMRTLDEFMLHARARAMSGKIDSIISFHLETNRAEPAWPEAPIVFPPTCRLQAAAFGVEGQRETKMVFYPSGNATPGHLLFISPANSFCTLTQTLRGISTVRCLP